MGPDAFARAERWAEPLRTWTALAQAAVGPDTIVLVGSYARGTYRWHGSDVDVLVVGGSLPTTLQDRYLLLVGLADDLHLPLEPLAYTAAEFGRMLDGGHVTACDALAFGAPLSGHESWERWLRRFETLQAAGLRRGEHAWFVPPAPT